MSRKIGITGGVGSGKSTLVHILSEKYHASVLIADEIGHEVFDPSGEDFSRLVAHFGSGILTESGQIDHAKLARIVFSDEIERDYLNGIVHPYVLNRIREEIDRFQGSLLVIESALMFESGCDRMCDEVWGVLSEEEIRIGRLMSTRGYSREKAESIMARQQSNDYFISKCDCVIYNNGSIDEVCEQVRGLISEK